MDLEFLREVWPTYAVLLSNIGMFMLTRTAIAQFTAQGSLRTFLEEFFATMELCIGVAELNGVYENQGKTAFAIVTFICCCWWYHQFGWAQAHPNGPLEGFVFDTGRGDHTNLLVAQILGGVASSFYSQLIWSLHLTAEHTQNVLTDCQSPLMIGVFWGMRTGGYFNGILASALSLGCKPHTYVQHFLVYWFGSFWGGSVGRFINHYVEHQIPYS
ncbi:aquaporin-11-like [Tropilaelaps mercedesae]|uniref:Aquaporin-11-like n=1 Tax=Tropilaelaps mercedesae TaxID=418985 RepID=A0A1V9XK93_9ACAR|nr:aquaporin-11-like [Tropilaelaps mercedesae]